MTTNKGNVMKSYELHRMGKEELETMYLDWFNNYLTVEYFAEDKGITVDVANDIIDAGRIINQEN